MSMALAMEPELLMLDESMAGLTPVELREMIQLIRNVRSRGLTVVVVEHVMEAVMELSDRVIVLNSGRKIVEGSPKEVVANPEVIRAYLGEGICCRSIIYPWATEGFWPSRMFRSK